MILKTVCLYSFCAVYSFTHHAFRRTLAYRSGPQRSFIRKIHIQSSISGGKRPISSSSPSCPRIYSRVRLSSLTSNHLPLFHPSLCLRTSLFLFIPHNNPPDPLSLKASLALCFPGSRSGDTMAAQRGAQRRAEEISQFDECLHICRRFPLQIK